MTKNINPNQSSCDSQKARILAHLQTGKSITAIQALRLYGCLRLSGRIYDIQKDGHAIHSKIIATRGGKHVSQYKLIQ